MTPIDRYNALILAGELTDSEACLLLAGGLYQRDQRDRYATVQLEILRQCAVALNTDATAPIVPRGWHVWRESPDGRWILYHVIGDYPPIPMLGQDIHEVCLEKWAHTIHHCKLPDVTIPLAAVRGLLYAIYTDREPRHE